MPKQRPVPAATRVVLVTGGAKRIGRAIALAFARSGWDVAIHYGTSRREARATAAEIESLGRRTVLLSADLAQERAVTALVPKAIAALGRLDCIVNNASRFEVDTADTCSFASLDRHYRTNTAAPVILTRELARHVQRGAQACVVNLLDQKLFNPNPDFLSYTLSKSALHAATTLLAQALAPAVRVVGVAPGISLTSGDQSEAGFEDAHTRTPLGRSSTPEDVAAAVLFAAESRAITGSTILVDGGQHLVPTARDIMFLTETAPARPRSKTKAKTQ
ncbi:MAG: SDR family oxidoreductase [Burkholderiaceae bacterium]|nr:SDR family oxidoreductase [Burkholderiaceae bacterium]